MAPVKAVKVAVAGAVELGGSPLLPKAQPALMSRGQSLRSLVQWYSPPRRPYTLRELLADRFINFLGAALSWVWAALLAERSWAAGDSLHKQMGFWAQGLGLIVMLNCSAMYHYVAWRWDWAHQLLSLDHIGISTMIMGSYAPFMVHMSCFRTLTFVCFLGIIGWISEGVKCAVGAKHFYSGESNWSILDVTHIVRYLVMGWSCVVLIPQRAELPPQAVVLLSVAGLLYTGGVGVFVRGSMEFHMAVWHGAVLVASLCIFLASLLFMVGLPLSHVKP